MLYTIVIHEILDHLRSLRFMMTSLVLILLMMVSAALFLPNYRQQEKDFAQNMHDTMSVLTKRALEEGALKNIFGNDYTGPGIYSPPNHLSFISENIVDCTLLRCVPGQYAHGIVHVLSEVLLLLTVVGEKERRAHHHEQNEDERGHHEPKTAEVVQNLVNYYCV